MGICPFLYGGSLGGYGKLILLKAPKPPLLGFLDILFLEALHI
jgi:hypothetical protein